MSVRVMSCVTAPTASGHGGGKGETSDHDGAQLHHRGKLLRISLYTRYNILL